MDKSDDPPKRTGTAKDGTNRGRPPGSLNRITNEAREKALAGGGLMPHEILLQMARGPFDHYVHATDAEGKKLVDAETGDYVYVKRMTVLDHEGRRDAAKAAAPYYAPKLSSVETIGNLGDDELDAIIRGAAAEAGLGVGVAGKGAADEVAPGTGSRTSRPRKVV